MKASASLEKRYIVKVLSNIFNTLSGLISITLVPRALGPAIYGNYSFLTEISTKIVDLFSFSTSIGFFTKISQRQKEQKLIRFYFGFIAVSISLAFLFSMMILLSSYSGAIFLNQQNKYIILALIFAALNFLMNVLRNINDAYALTIQSEKSFIFQKLLFISIIVGLFYSDFLSLTTFYLNHIFSTIVIIALWAFLLNKNVIKPFHSSNKLNFSQIKNYIKEFYNYAFPLLVYTIFAFITAIADRWLLEKYGGSIEQGYFGLAFRIGAIIFVFTNAIIPLFIREFSVAWGNNDKKEMRHLFEKIFPLFFFITAFFAIFISINSDLVIEFLGGEQYKDAGLVLSILVFYPIHQTYGQLNGSIFYATARTKLYRNTGLIMMTIGLFITFLMIGPTKLGGLELGALGLAIKMIIIQFITVNLRMWYNVRLLDIPFFKVFIFQFITPAILFLLASFSFLLFREIIQNNLLFFFIHGIIYTFIALITLILFPNIIGFSRIELIKKIFR